MSEKFAIIPESGFEKPAFWCLMYNNPPKPPAPNWLYHYEKMAFNKACWYLVPTGVI
jgi:sulfide:quinone oxidoreductase